MDQSDFALLLAHTAAQERRLRQTVDECRHEGRGTTFVELVRLHLDGVADFRSDLADEYATAIDAVAKAAVERKAVRLRESLDELHYWVVRFAPDAGRPDIPVGLFYLVDTLMEAVGIGDSDALVHTDDNYMYSVISPIEPLADLFANTAVTFAGPVTPVILNLPGADPTNVLLSPILAHEVGHPAVIEHGLLPAFNSAIDFDVIKPIWDECLAMEAPESYLRTALSKWVSELLCDAIATATTGPSMLFASLAFLPGPLAGWFGDSHPDPGQRIALTLSWLDDLGWSGWLVDRTPEVQAWASALAVRPPDGSVTPVLRKLAEVVPACGAAIWSVVKPMIGNKCFRPDEFDPFEAGASARLERGIPAVEVDGTPITPWAIVLAAWTFAIRSRGGHPASVTESIDDRDLNAAALKAIELSSVMRLWGNA